MLQSVGLQRGRHNLVTEQQQNDYSIPGFSPRSIGLNSCFKKSKQNLFDSVGDGQKIILPYSKTMRKKMRTIIRQEWFAEISDLFPFCH